jgi:hypothetical protein
MGLFSRLFGGKRSAPAEASPVMVSLVALLRQAVRLDRAALEQKLDAVFPGQFVPQNENSFVVDGPDPTQFMAKSLVASHSGLFFVICRPEAYVDVSSFALNDRDPRLQDLLRQHNAWLSVDQVAPIGGTEDAYRFIGRALAKLAPDDSVALVHPQTNAMVPFDSETRAKLRSEAVLRALGMES